jgi:hypothetical protein
MGGREAEEEGNGGSEAEIGAGKVHEAHGVLGDSNPDGGGDGVPLFWKGGAPEVEERRERGGMGCSCWAGEEGGKSWAGFKGRKREDVGQVLKGILRIKVREIPRFTRRRTYSKLKSQTHFSHKKNTMHCSMNATNKKIIS